MKDAKKTLKKACEAIEDKKGERLTVLDVHDIASFTHFMVICEGRNQRQNQAICDSVITKLKREEGLPPSHVEGYQEASWILIDYLEFIIHVFSPEARDFYRLDRLWSDGVRLEPQALMA
ncbi:MAG: ribosome silencing factor [Acidobacteriota bacterium]